MDYHLDRKIILNEDSEFESLYKWSLQEIDTSGSKIGRDQIPWSWTLYFTADDLTLTDSVDFSRDFQPDPSIEEKLVVKQTRGLRATLRPDGLHRGAFYREPSYSMFGTDRDISSFELFIEAISSGENRERCVAWGSVSYTTEIDFRDDTSDDAIVFHFYVRPEIFDRLAQTASTAAVDHVSLRVRGVPGFYSDWSPAITTDKIKVLTSYEEHGVEIPSASGIVPPRLGEVREANLTFSRTPPLLARPRDTDGLDVEDGIAPSTVDAPALSESRATGLLASVRIAAWLIAALLFLNLLK